MKKTIRKIVPRSVKFFARRNYYSVLDVLDTIKGRRDSMTPPRRMIFVGAGDYKKIGDEFFKFFKELGDLKPHEKVLDVGCGIGRMAVPLTDYLNENENGTYNGFDIVKEGINWSKKNISNKFPNFKFELADVYNKYYNKNGKFNASEYVFPYENESFDFVFLTSVFTHMLPRDLEHYLSEISRVMKKGARCLITYFVLNEESLKLIEEGKCTQHFVYDFNGYKTIDPDVPEDAVAFDEKYIRDLYSKYGLEIKEPIHFGSWCERQNPKSYQDIIIATKV